ncbi:MAG: hypothetical protein GX147_05160 [Deltaproteobacteria bacterium]|nr:hypothetical protein [Deltaproteobacteria bacterium]
MIKKGERQKRRGPLKAFLRDPRGASVQPEVCTLFSRNRVALRSVTGSLKGDFPYYFQWATDSYESVRRRIGGKSIAGPQELSLKRGDVQ